MQKKSKFNVFAFMMLIILGLTFQPAISTYAACPDGISSYWKLDGTAGPTYADFISDNDGSTGATTEPTAVTGIVNGAQQFDSTADTKLDVSPDSSFGWYKDESFSIEFWIKRDGNIAAGDPNEVAIGRDDPAGLQWWVGIRGNDVNTARFLLKNNDGTESAAVSGNKNITDNEWHHVVAVRDAENGQILLYVDGALDAPAVPASYDPGFDSTTANLSIGYLNAGTFFRLNGFLDEIALYNKALTATEILQHYTDGLTGQDYCLGSDPFVPFPDDTISLWRLDEAAGPDYADAFSDNDGSTGATTEPTAVTGIVNGAQQFDSTADTKLDVSPDSSFGWYKDESFSIEFWIKRDGNIAAGDPNEVAIGRDDPAGLQWWVGIRGNDVNTARFLLKNNDGTESAAVSGNKNITDNEWHHVVAVRDAENGQNLLYVDGALDAPAVPASYDPGFDSTTANLSIGYLNAGTFFRLNGFLDEVALYNRVLTPDEIEDHFEAGEAGRGIDRLGGVPEIIGSWSSGIWYWDTAASTFTNMTELPGAIDIAAGDFNADGIADVASSWVSGLWYQNGATLDWTFIDIEPPSKVTAGDVTGDGRDEIIVARDSGIDYWDATTSQFTNMTELTGTFDIAAGDFNADGIADVASSWVSGLWYQDGSTLAWTFIDTEPPSKVTAGDVTGDGRDEIIVARDSGIDYWDATTSQFTNMTELTGTFDIAAGDFNADGIADVASSWVSGLWYQDGSTLDWTFIFNFPPTRVTAGDVTGQ